MKMRNAFRTIASGSVLALGMPLAAFAQAQGPAAPRSVVVASPGELYL